MAANAAYEEARDLLRLDGVRCAFRYGYDPYLRLFNMGFRVVVLPAKPGA